MALNKQQHKCPDKKTTDQPVKKKSLTIKRTPKKNSAKKADLKKKITHFPYDIYTRKRWEVNEKNIINICKKLLKWASLPNSLFMEKFWIETLHMHPRTGRKLINKFEELAIYYDTARCMIGIRREEKAHAGEIPARIIEKTARHYFEKVKMYDRAEKEFEAELKYRYEMKLIKLRAELMAQADTDEKKAAITWVMEKFPDSTLVPPKTAGDK